MAALDACIGRLEAQFDVGYDRIAKRCPELAPALEQSGWAAWLPQGWKESRNDLSVGSLRELRRVVTRELATHAATQAPRVERLKEILTGLGSNGQERSSAWSRFKQWVRSLFERAGQQKSGVNWLSRLISKIGVSEATIDVITYVALGLVVALAGFIVFNELRLAGVLGRRRSRNAIDDAADVPGRSRVTWGDVERAALADQPRLLLELIATKLMDLQRLPPAGAFTVRELLRAADLNQPADRERLREIALTAERARYAEEDVAPAAVETAVGHARELLTHLESREPAAASAAGAKA